MMLQLPFDGSDWERIERAWGSWWAGELDRPLFVLECTAMADRYDPHCASTFLANAPSSQPPEETLQEFIPRLQNTRFLGDAFPRFWVNYGPGVCAAFAGARVHPAWDTTWFLPVGEQPISALRVEMDWGNPWWRRVEAFTQAALKLWGNELAVGVTDLGGNLDILASLRGTKQLLMDLVRTPDEVARLVGETSRLWLACFDSLTSLIAAAGRGITCWGPLWAPGRGYMLQSDFSCMISPAMFERFVLPDLEACCGRMDYAFYHLDGVGQMIHLDALLSLPRLRGIQWVPGYGKPPCEAWLPLLSRIRASGKLCQVTVSPQGALEIMRALGGRGFCFVIDEPPLTPAEGQAFLREASTFR